MENAAPVFPSAKLSKDVGNLNMADLTAVTSRVHKNLQKSYELGEQFSARPIALCVRNIWEIKKHHGIQTGICIGFMCYDPHGQIFEFRLTRETLPNGQEYLAEGEIYEFTGYFVKHNPRPRKLTQFPYYICLDQTSKILKVMDISPMLYVHSFSPQNYKTLLHLATVQTYLPDVIGQIRVIQKRNPYRPGTSVDITIGLLLSRSIIVKVILWDKVAADFSILQTKKSRNSKVIIFTSLIPKLYEGKLHLNTCPATAFYFDKSIEQIKHFKGRVEIK